MGNVDYSRDIEKLFANSWPGEGRFLAKTAEQEADRLMGPSQSNSPGLRTEYTGGGGDERTSTQQRDTTEQLTRQLAELARIAEQQAASVRENTLAVLQGAGSGVKRESNSGVDALQGAAGFLMKGLTLAPVISGLGKLFGGGENETSLPPPEHFYLPAPIRAEAGLSASGQMYAVDRGAGDQVRVLHEQGNPVAPILRPDQGSQMVAQNITVNVNAMDSRSFLDRSDDIARAVREAMLHSHSLNDIVADL